MKLSKTLLLLLLVSFTFSCSQDATEDQMGADSTSKLDAAQFDDSHLGEYKGLFTTNDGLTRGSVVVNLSPSNEGTAQITLSSGEVIDLKSAPVKLTVDNNVSNLRFSSTGLSPIDATLDFSVENNGTSPMVSNVSFDNKQSDILIVKNLSRAPANAITGTFDCDNCAAVGVGFPNGRTWNVMTMGAGGNTTYAVQISYDGNVYTTTANQGACGVLPFFPSVTACTISGSAQILGFDLTYAGTHYYSTSPNESCSSVSGTWDSNYGTGSGASGTFTSDGDNCF